MSNGKIYHKSGIEWAALYGINILNPKGWSSDKDFKTKKITYSEFLNRCANSVVERLQHLSRRDAALLKKKLVK